MGKGGKSLKYVFKFAGFISGQWGKGTAGLFSLFDSDPTRPVLSHSTPLARSVCAMATGPPRHKGPAQAQRARSATDNIISSAHSWHTDRARSVERLAAISEVKLQLHGPFTARNGPCTERKCCTFFGHNCMFGLKTEQKKWNKKITRRGFEPRKIGSLG